MSIFFILLYTACVLSFLEYAKEYVVTHPSSENLYNYESLFILNSLELQTAGELNGDCDDMLFVGEGLRVLPHFVESGCGTDHTSVFVRMNLTHSIANRVFLLHGDSDFSTSTYPGSTFWGGESSGASAKFSLLSKSSTCPASWTAVSSFDGHFLRISSKIDTGVQMGEIESSHTHTCSGKHTLSRTSSSGMSTVATGSSKWGRTSTTGTMVQVNPKMAHGALSPPFANMSVESVAVYSDKDSGGPKDVRVGVYQGGSSSDMIGATRVFDGGKISNQMVPNWLESVGSFGGTGILQPSTFTWVVFKENNGAYFMLDTAAGAEDDYAVSLEVVNNGDDEEGTKFVSDITVSETTFSTSWYSMYMNINVYQEVCKESHSHEVDCGGVGTGIASPPYREVTLCVSEESDRIPALDSTLISFFDHIDAISNWNKETLLYGLLPLLGDDYQSTGTGEHTHEINYEASSISECLEKLDSPVVSLRVSSAVDVNDYHTHSSLLASPQNPTSSTSDVSYLPARIYFSPRTPSASSVPITSGMYAAVNCEGCQNGENLIPPIGWEVFEPTVDGELHLAFCNDENEVGMEHVETNTVHTHPETQTGASTEVGSISSGTVSNLESGGSGEDVSHDHIHDSVTGGLASGTAFGDIPSVSVVLIKRKESESMVNILRTGLIEIILQCNNITYDIDSRTVICLPDDPPSDNDDNDDDSTASDDDNDDDSSADDNDDSSVDNDDDNDDGGDSSLKLIIGVSAGGAAALLVVVFIICIGVMIVLILCVARKKRRDDCYEEEELIDSPQQFDKDDVEIPNQKTNSRDKKNRSKGHSKGKKRSKGHSKGKKSSSSSSSSGKKNKLKVIILEKFFNIKDAETLLKEDEASNEEYEKLNINHSLYELNFSSVKLVRVLGRGGSNSNVFLANWNDQEVAVKLFHAGAFASQEDYDMFEREIEIMASLRHPNIIQFYGATLKPPRLAILLEYAQNGTIKDYHYSGGSLQEKTKIDILFGIACSLEEKYHPPVNTYSKFLIFSDLKPDNVLLNNEFKPKLADFGLSRVFSEFSKNKTHRIGTSHYMAPEMITKNDYDDKVDIFSFGITIFEIMTDNYNPYGNVDNVEHKVASSEDFRPKLSLEEEKKIPQWALELAQACWAHNSENRPSASDTKETIKANLQKGIKMY